MQSQTPGIQPDLNQQVLPTPPPYKDHLTILSENRQARFGTSNELVRSPP